MSRVREYRPAQVNFLREVPGSSPVHRLWAGTKLLSVLGLSFTLSYFPTWGACGVAALLLVASIALARIPSGAWPRLPRWFWVVLAVTGLLASLSGGSPHVKVGGTLLGFGGLDAYGKFMAVGILLLLAAAVLGWTTALAEIAPAMATLLRPLSLIRVPVDEAATVLALSVRSLPLILGEIRALLSARRLRPSPDRTDRSLLEVWLDEVIDVIVAAMAVSVRRAGELAEAISARGGAGRITAQVRRPGLNDVVAMLLVGGACYAATLIPG